MQTSIGPKWSSATHFGGKILQSVTFRTNRVDRRKYVDKNLVASAHRNPGNQSSMARREALLAGLISLGMVAGQRPSLAEEAAPLPDVAQTPLTAPPSGPEGLVAVENSTPLPPSESPLPAIDAPQPPPSSSKIPLGSEELTNEAAKKLMEEEEERRKKRKRGKGRIRELEEIRAELAEKELVLLEKEQELLDREQTVMVLREELDIQRKLRALLTKEKEKAEEEAALAMGLCTGGSMLP